MRATWGQMGWTVGLAAIVATCTPSGSTGDVIDTHAIEPPAPAASVELPRSEVGCGALEITSLGPWRTDHPLLAPLRAGWHPRAEHGRPVAVRDAIPPWPLPGHTFVQVQLEGVPRAVQPCWVPTAAEGPSDRRECGVLWDMLSKTPAEAKPRTARDWARLVAADDGAAAVFTGPDELEACSDAPPPIAEWTHGLRADGDTAVLTFVERMDNPRSTIWLRVDVRQGGDTLRVDRSEIATVVRATPGVPPPPPNWDAIWPMADDPMHAGIGLRAPRTHPLWPTPVSDACPAVMFSALTPNIRHGDTVARVNAALPRPDHFLHAGSPLEVVLLHDHLGLPGVRLVAAMDHAAGCTMGWSHTHCLVADDALWCPDGTATDLQAIVDRFALAPSSLSDHQWFELAAIMTGSHSFVLEPSLLSACTQVSGARADAPRVSRGWNRVTIEFTAIDQSGQGDRLVVELANGRVTMTKTRAWTAPDPDDAWGTLQ